MGQSIYFLNSNDIPSLDEVGGKAKSLIETTQAGLPVPDGLVLSTSFFKPWVDEIKQSSQWDAMSNKLTKETCDRLKEKAQSLKLTQNQQREFYRALTRIPSNSYAVRSSVPEEDLTNMSFAGMYESYLGILPNQLDTYIAKTFSSMLDYRVMSYKIENNIDISQATIAVIVQKQLASTVSGIGFSLNPQNNAYDEVVINASFGLGEAIVSGLVTPDRYIIDMGANRIFLGNLGDKKTVIHLKKGGGTYKTVSDRGYIHALTKDNMMRVARLIKKCENFYQFPVNTEWAFEENKLYLLQCRPITTYFPFYPDLLTKKGQEKELYFDIIKASQGFEWSMSTLGCELFGELINVAKQGLMPVGGDGLVYCCHGRMYLQLGNATKVFGEKRMIKMLENLDPVSAKIYEQIQMKDYIPDQKPDQLKGVISRTLKIGLKTIGPMVKSQIDFEKSIANYKKFTAKWTQELDDMLGSQDLFSHQVDKVYKMYSQFIMKIMPFTLSILATSALRKLFKGENMEEDILTLNMDLKGNPTSEMGYHQLQLASEPEFIACKSYEEFQAKLDQEDFSDSFMTSYHTYMKKYGCRGIGEIDIARPRTHEDIPAFYELLKQINIHDNAIQRNRQKKEESFQRLLSTSKKIRKEKRFRRIASQLEWAGIREHPKYMYVYGIDILRMNVLEIAKDLVQQKQLKSVEDIFYLTPHAISQGQKNNKLNLNQLVVIEKRARLLTKDVKSWPMLFDSRGKIFTLKQRVKPGELAGEPVSPGIIRGRAKVLHEPFAKRLEKGEILIAPSTEPSWTPIFINASGVIMEIGGILQHGAIIAREYGIPCITGVQNATSLIQDGDLIEIDGTSGIVKIIDEN